MRRVIPFVLLALVLAGGAFWLLRQGPPSRPLPLAPTAQNGTIGPAAGTTARDPEVNDTGPRAVDGRSEEPSTSLGTAEAVHVRGRVVDPRGAAIAEADVYVAPEGRANGIPLEDLDPATSPWAGRTQARTDATGRFQIETVRGASTRFVVRARAFARYERTIASRTNDGDLGDVVLAEGLVLSGHVVDAHDRPIADAVLRSLPFDAKPAVILGSGSGDVVAKSGADGAFRIDEMPAGPWLLSIRAADRPDKIERGDTRTDPTSTERKIVLADGAEIRGRVTRAPEGSLEKLFVRAVPTGARAGSAVPSVAHVDEDLMLATPRTARCAADGTFVVRGLTGGVVYRLSARESESDPFARVRTNRVEARAGDQSVELVYQPDHALVFQVVDARTTQPVEDFEARFGHGFLQPLAPSREDAGPARRSEGRVRAELGSGLRTGDTFDLVIESIGHQPLRLADVRVPEGDIELGVLRLEPAPSISVTVLDAQTHSPVKGARVKVCAVCAMVQLDTSSPVTGPREGALTDEHGVARLNLWLLDRAARLVVRHPDYTASIGDEIGDAPVGEISRTVLLARGGRVVVEVQDALGAPARGVHVRHTGVRGEVEPPTDALASGARTDARGELVFTRLESGDHLFEIELETGVQSDGDASRAHANVTEGGETRVSLRVPARARLSGRVTTGGQPLAGATLRFAPRDATQVPGDDALAVRTNGFGEYTLQSLPMGAYRAMLDHPSRAMMFVADLDVRDVQARFDVDLPLATISGRVVDSAGNAVVGARVRAEAAAPDAGSAPTAGEPSSRMVTGADGTFELRGVRVDVDLAVGVDDGEHQPARSGTVRVGANETRSGVDFVLAEGAALEVSLFSVEGEPVSGARVRVIASGPAREATSDGTGTARFRGLAPGTWRIVVDAAERYGVIDGWPSVEVKTGAENRLRIDLR